MKTNFVINQKLLGNPSTIYKTVKTQTINEEVNNLCAAMTALNPAFEGVNPIELKKNELIEWYQKTAKVYAAECVKAAAKVTEEPKAEEPVVKVSDKKKEKKSKAEKPAKKSRIEDAQARLDKYSEELSRRNTELENLKSAEEPDKAKIKTVSKRIASLGRKLKRAQAAMASAGVSESQQPTESAE